MLGLKLNHVSKRGHWWGIYLSISWVVLYSRNSLSPAKELHKPIHTYCLVDSQEQISVTSQYRYGPFQSEKSIGRFSLPNGTILFKPHSDKHHGLFRYMLIVVSVWGSLAHISKMACCPGGHFWNYYPGSLPPSQDQVAIDFIYG